MLSAVLELAEKNHFARPSINLSQEEDGETVLCCFFTYCVTEDNEININVECCIRGYPGHNSRKCDVVVFGASKLRGRRYFSLRNLRSSYLEPREFDVAVFGALKF